MLELNSVNCGDSRLLVKSIEPLSVQLTITSPPYFQQRKYENENNCIGNELSVQEYIRELCLVFKEVEKITKEDGIIIINLGDKIINGCIQLIPYTFASQLQDQTSLKLINVVEWVKVNPTPRPTAKILTPAHEPFFIFSKSNKYKFNIDDYKNDAVVTHMRNKKDIGGQYLKIIMATDTLSAIEKTNAVADVMKARKEVESGKISEFRMKIRGVHKLPYGGQAGGRLNQINNNGYTIIKMYGKQIKKDWFECSVANPKIGENHPAVYPKEIITEFIKLFTDKGDVVLDCFSGSGVTPVCAKKLQRDYIAIDVSKNYCDFTQSELNKIPTI